MYLLDTNICIYIINRKLQRVVEIFDTLKTSAVKLSSVTIAELEYGASKSAHREKNRAALLNFKSPFEILPFNDRDAEIFGIIKADLESRGKPIGPYDIMIAAQALSRDLTLVTNNASEFKRVHGLKLENWI